MDQYIVSARKYRPATFDTVVGQNHIGETLKNAIKNNHLAQAFLFSGPRGVGKTTCARILAKTINCMDRTEDFEACEKCESCKSFNEGHSLNIYELDAASNNSVDDIRSLIDQVRFAPQLGTKKVYIIDEVHMLSASAFNAFLKTLEEPPKHAIFILATTEKHKVIPTILSRCQVFDFNRIELEDMVDQLARIAEKESVEAERDALHLIARKSDGSMRDALSMFDQMVTYAGQQLSYKSVVENLSILDADQFFDLSDNLIQGDAAAALKQFDSILNKGFDGHHFILGLAEHFRNLLVAQDPRTVDLISAGKSFKERYGVQAQTIQGDYLIKGLNTLSKIDVQYKSSRNQRLLVELALINLSAHETERKEEATTPKAIHVSNTDKKKPPLTPEPVVEKTIEPVKSVQESTSITSSEEHPSPPSETKDEGSEAKIESEKPSEDKIEEKAVVSEGIKDSEEIKKGEDVAVKESVVPDKKEVLDTIEKSIQKPAMQKTRYNPNIVTDTISIKDFTEPESDYKKDTESEVTKEIRNEDFDEELFLKVWKKLLVKTDVEKKMNLFSTLSKYPPELTDAKEVIVTYDNKAQVEVINGERLDLVSYLRDELNNDHIKIKLKLSDQQYKKAYTPSEKLEQMIEKNPNINTLKERLNLDINH